MRKYIKILRLNHWIKQLFIFPGVLIAFVIAPVCDEIHLIAIRLILGFISTCLIASSNYVINEWLDAKFDKFHPVKKNRSVVENKLHAPIVYFMYVLFALVGLAIAWFVQLEFFIMALCLWIMGIIYNVRPLRTKDIAILDVLTESLNNAIRFLMGWFIVTSSYLPPVSIVIGYWFAGSFLMAIKRYSEYRMINDKDIAAKYRKSFKFYNRKSLLVTSFFYAMISVMFIGIFLIKYRVELIIFMPFFIGLYCYYFWLSFRYDSPTQKPETLYKEKGLFLYICFISIVFCVLMFVDIPLLESLMSNQLILL